MLAACISPNVTATATTTLHFIALSRYAENAAIMFITNTLPLIHPDVWDILAIS